MLFRIFLATGSKGKFWRLLGQLYSFLGHYQNCRFSGKLDATMGDIEPIKKSMLIEKNAACLFSQKQKNVIACCNWSACLFFLNARSCVAKLTGDLDIYLYATDQAPQSVCGEKVEKTTIGACQRHLSYATWNNTK